MVRTRANQVESQQTNSSPYKYQRRHTHTHDDLLDELIEDMSENNREAQIIVPVCEKLNNYRDNFIGNSFIMVGPEKSGKDSHIIWLSKYLQEKSIDAQFISIDCRIYQTDSQFLNQLTRELRKFLGEGTVNKHIVINETKINLNGLNKEFEQMKRKLILIIKYAQVLGAQKRKQSILYNIFEWLNNTNIKKYITVIITSRKITFFDLLEKRIKSRMNLPIIYLPKIKPSQVLQVIIKRIDFRIENSSAKNEVLLQKIKLALVNNKALNKTIQEQYQFSPQNIVQYLNIMKLILSIDIRTIDFLQKATQGQLSTTFAQGFQHYSEFTCNYKNMAKNLFINLSLPQIVLLGFIRQRLANQQSASTEINLKKIIKDYISLMERKAISELGTSFRYNQKILQESTLKLQDLNFITIAKIDNIELFQRSITSQYSPEDILHFFNEYCKEQQGVPSFLSDLYYRELFLT